MFELLSEEGSSLGGLICMGFDLGEPMFRRDLVIGCMEYFGFMVNWVV